ncbi:MAG: phenylacetic acid degradation bifunctional protein PaaZ [Haliscomenobacter sp.]|uniref:phenylacetic acid degradation bifunctional protein PaaZ n=1 Tax=Haliscomenobacter sp. TaxID=2717303 RepID=UPI0029B59F31|nr:phenylacetic acid degradation bifunctional protein PaaZ [Haliscomenobacter sp.]MDX2067693.1 phenylacetic acid degradation bifunctional protein PaaZ [Haliscomenobacter sp.]
MSTKLHNYLLGAWVPHDGEGIPQFDAIDGTLIGTCGSEGLDYSAILHYACKVGGPALRKMSFQERGRMLKALALFLNEQKEKYYTLSYRSGATRADSWIDIDGGIGTLFAYASLRRKLPDTRWYLDGEAAKLSKEGSFIGHHLMVPKHGVAIHINAFNFPIWGMLEKLSANLLAGMPAVVKPSEVTSYLSEIVVRDIIASGILPAGALQLVCGSGIGILDDLCEQDVVTFTGSAATGQQLRALPSIIQASVPFNMEADSLNAIVLGPDVEPSSPDFELFLKEIRREMTAKTGQKCTAIRRIFVPENRIDAVQNGLSKMLAQTTLGDPRTEGVRMGALVSKVQQQEVSQQVEKLLQHSSLAFGNLEQFEVLGADKAKGAFFAPILLRNDQPSKYTNTHNIEAFGPVSTLMPYHDLEEAIELVNLGKGSLVSTIATADPRFAQEYVMEAAPYHGRILILNEASAKESTGHGSPMPLLSHGGPGRAGGGEELGGLRGIKHYLQRTAIQGHPSMLSQITEVYQVGGAQPEAEIHPFRKYFEDLQIGETLSTHKHTVTESDIINFANLTGDHFYAHVDETALEGTPFERRVAHGYWILSKAAGMFVEPRKGPVLLNYGLEECRFTKPVYPGMTIGVRLTVKEKIAQEQRDENDVPKGIVKWLVEVFDQTNETVAIATILTMVRKKTSIA